MAMSPHGDISMAGRFRQWRFDRRDSVVPVILFDVASTVLILDAPEMRNEVGAAVPRSCGLARVESRR